MFSSNKKNSFISFLLQKYNLRTEIEAEKLFSELSSQKTDNFKKALSRLENLKRESKDPDDYSGLVWRQAVQGRQEEINKLIKNVNSIIDSKKTLASKNLKELEIRNNKIIIKVSILSTALVFSLFALSFFPKASSNTLNFLDSLVLYPFNKLEEAYNFNYNQEVFQVARIDRKINLELKQNYIKNLKTKALAGDSIKVSKNSLINSSSKAKNNIPDNKIIVMGIDNADLIKKEEKNTFKEIMKKIAEKQIEISNKIAKKLLDLVY